MVAVGKFDGEHPSLAYATTGGKVCIYSAHAAGDQPRIQYLNINKQVTALAAGQLEPKSNRDVLLVGTNSSLQAYDVHASQDLFFKDIQDGVSALTVGKLSWTAVPTVTVGGASCVLGMDAFGNELYWTVTGDRVSALAISGVSRDDRLELIVGSDDFSIRTIYNDSVLHEIAEADKVIGLTPLEGTKFGYALANGTIGVYDRSNRTWRVKSKHTLTALCSHDMDGDGQLELISGWSNGRVSTFFCRKALHHLQYAYSQCLIHQTPSTLLR